MQPLSSSVKADICPVAVDSSVIWDSVGGLDRHVTALKEMVMLPLLYPSLFQVTLIFFLSLQKPPLCHVLTFFFLSRRGSGRGLRGACFFSGLLARAKRSWPEPSPTRASPPTAPRFEF